MKKFITLLTAIVLVLSLCACSKKAEESSWQDQYELGIQYLSEGKYEEAILTFIAAIEIDPKRVEAYEKLAEAYTTLNDTKSAIKTLRDGFVATGDTRLYSMITEITALIPDSSQALPIESTPAATPTSRSDLYPVDYIGMTIDSLTQLWGADYQTSEYFYTGEPRPIYYEDGRTMLVFYIQGTYDDYGVRGDDEITSVEVPETIDEVAPGIPARASYLQLCGLRYKGNLQETNESGTASYTIGYNREISILYCWYSHKDPRANQADSVLVWKEPEPLQTIHTVDFQIEDGVLVKYTGPGGVVTIPDGVTMIGGSSSIGQYDGAFSHRSTVTSVVIPDSVFSIGEWAFFNCMLSSIVIPDSVMDIGESAFCDCYFLSSIKIPNGLTKIEPYTFSGCSGLKSVTISNSVTDIGIGAFHGCSNLSSITIPKGVTWMNGMSFSECDSLKSFVVDANNSAFAAQDGVLFNKKLTELVRYPAGKGSSHYSIPDGTTYIGVEAFEGCSNLTDITIPNSVIRIAERAFSGCNALTDVYYLGTQEEWAAIDIGSYGDDDPLQNVIVHFNN